MFPAPFVSRDALHYDWLNPQKIETSPTEFYAQAYPGTNPAANDYHDTRAPGIRAQVFGQASPYGWPTRGSLYQTTGSTTLPIPQQDTIIDMLNDLPARKRQVYWHGVLMDEPSTNAVPFRNLGNWSLPYQGMDLGKLKEGYPPGHMQWHPYPM